MRLPGTISIALLLLAAAATGHAADLEDFAWLEGTWVREAKRVRVTETWRVLSDRTLEGESYVVSRETGERRLGESLLLAEMAGEVFYLPRPVQNEYPVAFRLTSVEDGRAVFENPRHDFPTKITYVRGGPDSMTVTIEGPAADGEPPRTIDFRFRRIP